MKKELINCIENVEKLQELKELYSFLVGVNSQNPSAFITSKITLIKDVIECLMKAKEAYHAGIIVIKDRNELNEFQQHKVNLDQEIERNLRSFQSEQENVNFNKFPITPQERVEVREFGNMSVKEPCQDSFDMQMSNTKFNSDDFKL